MVFHMAIESDYTVNLKLLLSIVDNRTSRSKEQIAENKHARDKHLRATDLDETPFLNKKIDAIKKFIDPWWALSEGHWRITHAAFTFEIDMSNFLNLITTYYDKMAWIDRPSSSRTPTTSDGGTGPRQELSEIFHRYGVLRNALEELKPFLDGYQDRIGTVFEAYYKTIAFLQFDLFKKFTALKSDFDTLKARTNNSGKHKKKGSKKPETLPTPAYESAPHTSLKKHHPRDRRNTSSYSHESWQTTSKTHRTHL